MQKCNKKVNIFSRILDNILAVQHSKMRSFIRTLEKKRQNVFWRQKMNQTVPRGRDFLWSCACYCIQRQIILTVTLKSFSSFFFFAFFAWIPFKTLLCFTTILNFSLLRYNRVTHAVKEGRATFLLTNEKQFSEGAADFRKKKKKRKGSAVVTWGSGRTSISREKYREEKNLLFPSQEKQGMSWMRPFLFFSPRTRFDRVSSVFCTEVYICNSFPELGFPQSLKTPRKKGP